MHMDWRTGEGMRATARTGSWAWLNIAGQGDVRFVPSRGDRYL